MPDETTRERIADRLRAGAATPTDLGDEFDVPPAVVYDHLTHVARSLADADEEFLAAPPECRDCGFDGFDDPLNQPSRCPECRSESVSEPAFKIGTA